MTWLLRLARYGKETEMPYKSEAQRKYFNANRDKLEAEGVDVDEWNESSKGKKFPEKKSGAAMLAKAAGDALQQLIEAKSESDRKNYAAKHAILRELLAQYPDDFKVDAATGKYHGLTHNPSGFKIHAPRDIAGMAKAAVDAVHPPEYREPSDDEEDDDDRIRANALSRRQSRNTLLAMGVGLGVSLNALSRRQSRNTLSSTGGGAVAGGALANYLHRKYREDEGDEGSGLERNLITAAGGLGGGALGYGISRLMQSKKASHQEWNEMETLKEKKSGVISDLFDTGREAQEKHDKEQEKLDKAVARNMRERLARQIAKEKFAMDKEAIGGLAGGALGTLLGMRNAKKEGRPKRHGAEEGFVRGALTGSGAGIGGSLGLLGSLSLMQGKPSTTKGVLAAVLPLLGAGAGGYAGYQGSESLTKDMRKSREGLQDYGDDRQDEFDEETLESLAKRAAAAGGIKDEDEDEDKQRGAGTPWGALGATAAGAAGLGTAYGIANDEQINRFQKTRDAYDPAAYGDQSKLPPNTTELQYYEQNMVPGASLKPFGRSVGDILSSVRTSPQIMGVTPFVDVEAMNKGEGITGRVSRFLSQKEDGKLNSAAEFLQRGVNTPSYMLASRQQKEIAAKSIETNNKKLEVAKKQLAAAGDDPAAVEQAGASIKALSEANKLSQKVLQANRSKGLSGAQHYNMFGRGSVPAYVHQMKAKYRHTPVPEDMGVAAGTRYSDWMGRKLEDFTATRQGEAINPYEFALDYMPQDEQVKFMQEFHQSLTPDEQAFRMKVEDLNDDQYRNQTENYMPKAQGLVDARNKLKQYGITAGGAGLGGLAGHGLYRALTDDDEESTTGGTLSSLAGMGLGGAGAYWSQTEQGKKHINDIISRLMSKKSGGAGS